MPTKHKLKTIASLGHEGVYVSEATCRRALAAALTAPAQPAGVPAVMSVEEYVAEYCWRGDGGDYTPNDNEKALLIDALHGAADIVFAAAPQPPAEGGWLPTRHDHEAGFCALLWDGVEIVAGRYEDGYTYGWVDSRGHPFNATHYRHLPLPPAPANGGEQNG